MPKRNVDPTDEQNAFVAEPVASDACQVASEAVRALQQRRSENALMLEALRAQVAVGLADLQSGAAAEVEDSELDAFLDGLAAPAAPRVDHRSD
jgi:Arc/MetJ-type ribon-helix-helix transcriptional regulator